MLMMPLHLHVNQKSDYDKIMMIFQRHQKALLLSKGLNMLAVTEEWTRWTGPKQ